MQAMESVGRVRERLTSRLPANAGPGLRTLSEGWLAVS